MSPSTSDVHHPYFPCPGPSSPVSPWSTTHPQLCLDILVRCTNLVSGRVATKQGLGWPADVSTIAGTSILEQMEELDISMRIRSTGDYINPFLQRLELPALKSLSLALTVARGNFDWFVPGVEPVIISFVARSPNLQYLHLWNILNTRGLKTVLQCSPALVELSLGDEPIDNDFFADLTNWEAEAPPLVPKLETLHLTNVGASFNEESMRKMIQSRWWSDDELLAMPDPPRIARLKRLKLLNQVSPKYFTEKFREKMKTWRSQGLDLEGF
ncbi:hypothetical protein MVEN_02627000 [Mycena venus]|uniref:F-box domain-containing protein n=1 Tax=Mycena venus TaxID=2733690 RepID=A0A8H6U154_9AGAR|nr:hypothetical protein MVEN_02627000 [Mycena venus]